jgi:hypothetical protein
MNILINARPHARAAAVLLALLVVGACGKKADEQPATQSSGGAIGPSSSTVQVADIALGRGLSADKRVSSETTTFGARDTIYASVHTTGAAPNTNITARWNFQDGQLVNERTETISPSGDAYTEFHIAKPSGWPTGKYTLHVLVNNQEVQTKDFTVQ